VRDGLITVESGFGVSETIDRLAAALAQAGLLVFARIDHAEGAHDAGAELRPRNCDQVHLVRLNGALAALRGARSCWQRVAKGYLRIGVWPEKAIYELILGAVGPAAAQRMSSWFRESS
jgi:hypothetical protein